MKLEVQLLVHVLLNVPPQEGASTPAQLISDYEKVRGQLINAISVDPTFLEGVTISKTLVQILGVDAVDHLPGED